MANKLMSKSELIQKLAEKHTDAVTRKDVKGVIESLAEIGYKELKKTGAFVVPRIREIRSDQETRHKSPQGHQSFHKGANSIQGEAGAEDHQGSPSKGYQRCSGLAPRTLVDFDVHSQCDRPRGWDRKALA